ncbi:MAG: 23S rRNA (guanine2445-N2)-methyltransferase / 23S rRNA (guanine2069-N7)-methyltransferase [bacterium]|jgi:23S rRNA (guanine2445-N2)-methyltransferase / 23S rRNA (guanine2069-N7)-methyltransferase
MDYSFLATAPKGVGYLLEDELAALGAENIKQTRFGASFTGPMEIGYKACLWSRLANRILLPIATFPVETPDELYEGVQQIDWFEHFNFENTFAIDFHSTQSKVNHSQYAGQKTKDAIVDQFRDRFKNRPSVETDKPDIQIHGYLFRDNATISIDLSGESLHKRGYRAGGGVAPLKENLAAAILMRAGWPEIAKQGGGLLDPMCGTGTLLIEGLFMAVNSAPGLLRDYFGFLGWKKYQSDIWEKLITEAEEIESKGLDNPPPIVGYDQNAVAIKLALANLEKAGLDGFIHFQKQELSECIPHPKMKKHNGIVVVNPPYGERLGEVRELTYLYRELGTKLKEEFQGWKATVFTGNEDLGKVMGLRAIKKYTLYNGAIECKLLNFDIEPNFEVQQTEKVSMFVNRVKKNIKKLKSWKNQNNIHCYRVYDHDLPEYAVAIDVYHSWVHVQEYAAPKTVDANRAKSRLNDILLALPEALDVPKENIFLKIRKKQKGKEQYNKQSSQNDFYEVREGDAKFLVNFADYLDTGLFLDHRSTREMIQEMAKGKRFLNLFAYTGSVTVYAGLGGATETTTVDMSTTYLEWAEKNVAFNGLRSPNNRFERADCRTWVKNCRKEYDLIFLDPPTFSNSKRMESSFDVQEDHVELILDTMDLLAKGGILIFSNNFRKFKMDFDMLDHCEIENLTSKTIPKDFERTSKIHNCWKITRKN